MKLLEFSNAFFQGINQSLTVVVPLGHRDQVLNPVVSLEAVKVVHNPAFGDFFAGSLLEDIPVLGHRNAIDVQGVVVMQIIAMPFYGGRDSYFSIAMPSKFAPPFMPAFTAESAGTVYVNNIAAIRAGLTFIVHPVLLVFLHQFYPRLGNLSSNIYCFMVTRFCVMTIHFLCNFLSFSIYILIPFLFPFTGVVKGVWRINLD